MEVLEVMVDKERLTGIFGERPKMTPDNVRRWLTLMREELGWTVGAAAAAAEIDKADVETLERSGETEALAAELSSLASVYRGAMFGPRGAACGPCEDRSPLDEFGQELIDGKFELAAMLRRRRAELGLSLEEVVAAVAAQDPYDYAANWYPLWEWGHGIDMADAFAILSSVLKVPVIELHRLDGDFTTEDLEEWFAWRKAQEKQTKKRRAA